MLAKRKGLVLSFSSTVELIYEKTVDQLQERCEKGKYLYTDPTETNHNVHLEKKSGQPTCHESCLVWTWYVSN